MTKREKFIVGVMTVAVIGGALSFVLESRDISLSEPGISPDLSATVTQAQAELQATELSARERHVLELARETWGNDPFRDRPLRSLDEDEGGNTNSLPVYTGYIHVGSQPLAIINGRDYREDQSLKDGGFRVAGIYADRVELVRPGSSDRILVPLDTEE